MTAAAHGFSLSEQAQYQTVVNDGAQKLRFAGSEALAVIQFAQLADSLTRPRLQMFCESPTGAYPHRYENQVPVIVIDGGAAKLGLANSPVALELRADKSKDESRKVVTYVDTPVAHFPWEAYAQFRRQLMAEQQEGASTPTRQDKDAGTRGHHQAPGSGNSAYTS